MPEPLSAVVPNDPNEISGALNRLLGQAGHYSQQYPEAAEAGGWWAMSPQESPPQMPLVDPKTARHAGVLMLFEVAAGHSPRLLLTERDAGLRQHPGQISLPGGGVEPQDDDLVATALREAQEETALDPDAVTVLGQLPPATMSVSGFMVTPVVGVTDDPGRLVPARGEVTTVMQLPVAELVHPQNRGTAVLQRSGVRSATPAFLVQGHFVWGFTGVLIDRVLTRMGWDQPWDAQQQWDPRDYSAFKS